MRSIELHAPVKQIQRSNGRSSVAAAAYRAGERLTDERTGLVHDYTKKQGIEHTRIYLPDNAPEFARDRARLWNAVEAKENRSNSCTAREFEVAFPAEFNAMQRREAGDKICHELMRRYGCAVDIAYHSPDKGGDDRNFHAHILFSTRSFDASTKDGWSKRKYRHFSNEPLTIDGTKTTCGKQEILSLRTFTANQFNRIAERDNLKVRTEHLSFDARGIDREPSQHLGQTANKMEQKGKVTRIGDLNREREERNGERARNHAQAAQHAVVHHPRHTITPDEVLADLTQQKSVFNERDIARSIEKKIENVTARGEAFAAVMDSRELVSLRSREEGDTQAYFSTQEMVQIESDMVQISERMATEFGHGVRSGHIEEALNRADFNLKEQAGAVLSSEQREAIYSMTASERIALVSGMAGTGKSTTIDAARIAWEAEGYRVLGASLSGKVAESLEQSANIKSRTLASYEMGWRNGYGTLSRNDIFVIDEAGMVGSRQLARVMNEINRAGAKVILVGDSEQLQAIGAGAPFRAIAERVGVAGLRNVRRQNEEWQREATKDFSEQRTHRALDSYYKNGNIRFDDDREIATEHLVKDYMTDARRNPDKSSIALAHRRVDVKALNDGIREAKKENGELQNETQLKTRDGKQGFAVGDRLVFLENNRDLGVKNGTLSTVSSIDNGIIKTVIDGQRKRQVNISVADYDAIGHGYATTIHKSQGATADRAYVMASGMMDRHLSYVSMSRHKEAVTLYVPQDEIKNMVVLKRRLSRDGSKKSTLDYLVNTGKENVVPLPPRRAVNMNKDASEAERIRQVERESQRFYDKLELERKHSRQQSVLERRLVETYSRKTTEKELHAVQDRLKATGLKKVVRDITRKTSNDNVDQVNLKKTLLDINQREDEMRQGLENRQNDEMNKLTQKHEAARQEQDKNNTQLGETAGRGSSDGKAPAKIRQNEAAERQSKDLDRDHDQPTQKPPPPREAMQVTQEWAEKSGHDRELIDEAVKSRKIDTSRLKIAENFGAQNAPESKPENEQTQQQGKSRWTKHKEALRSNEANEAKDWRTDKKSSLNDALSKVRESRSEEQSEPALTPKRSKDRGLDR